MSKELTTLLNSGAAPRPAFLSLCISSLFPPSARKIWYSSGALMLALNSGLAMGQSGPSADTAAPDPAASETTKVIVTGTRQSGMKAVDSPAPVQVIDASALERTGQPDLIQAIAQLLPSFTAQAVGGDTANLTLSARLRGLSSNDTLVLINGKRRHGTANLAVLGGPYQGGAAADLNFIPVSAIDHIEVLSDGAAAQYGTDAIAGVINIILKSESSGGSVNTTGGRYLDGGGKTGDISVNDGFELGEDGFVNLTAEDK
jgi:iron complex outermembrane receptor protein